MFKFLKEKISSFFKKTKEKTEEKKEKLVKPAEKKLKEKKQKKEKQIKEREKKKKKNLEDIKEERKVTEKVLEDIKEEGIEISSPEKRTEELAEKKLESEETGKEEKGFWARIKNKFNFRISEEDFEEIFSDLEFSLLENNVSIEVEEKIKEILKKELVGKEIKKLELEESIKSALKKSVESILIEPFDLVQKIKEKQGTFVILFFGINGSGKTTTIAKLANLLNKNKISSVLAAGDTFRAASIEQLTEHAKKLKIEIIKSQYNADPASVAFDAIKHANSRNIKVVLIDTAGRMHTKENLMKEMQKISRVSKADMKIFIAESITGSDAIEQAKAFNEAVGIDGVILSKVDVDEKGGTALSLSYMIKKPILYLGIGQNYEDLEKFDKEKIIKNLGL
ncbi:signal recognition particle-docking protein FtsY [Candidatus Pacearchaeota archaeon]|nr:signal recognition particle-docking protein FtsY [Candidatus Pacearchaeota archaeon]